MIFPSHISFYAGRIIVIVNISVIRGRYEDV